MSHKIVFMFSGQGSQYYQMGKDLYDNNDVFKKWIKYLDEVAYRICGHSIIEQMYDSNHSFGEPFSNALFSSSAIFMIEYAMSQVLIEAGIKPDYVLGASLGEFASVAIASEEKAEFVLKMIIEQTHIFESDCLKGGMLVILHDYSLFREIPLMYQNSELASINYDTSFVVSGSNEKLCVIVEFLKRQDIMYQELPVSYAYHSTLIDNAVDCCLAYLNDKTFKQPKVPIVSCMYGDLLTEIPSRYFWDVVRQPIKIPEAIKKLEKINNGKVVYLDLGPAGTLANFTKRNITNESQSEVYEIITPFKQSVKNLNKIKNRLIITSNSKGD